MKTPYLYCSLSEKTSVKGLFYTLTNKRRIQMKNPNLKLKSFLILILALSLLSLFATCKDDDPPDDPPQPHQSTITAFGRTITVTGDASISTADFNTAKGKLQDTLSALDEDTTIPQVIRTGLTNMMTRTITIVPGNTVPASLNGALTVGVDYLKSNDVLTIGGALFVLINANAFAD
jgi:hypothetical protein